MRDLSYQEKSLYAALLANLAVFVPYFVLIHDLRRLTLDFIAGWVTLLIAAQIVLQGVLALATRNRLKDERDRLIQLRGYRAGYVTVLAFMLLGTAALWLHVRAGQINPNHMALHFLSVFFAILMMAELVRTITQLMAYRRPL